ncbi:hypothetical protein MHU86_16939 [Fragilaria crotonensis]|nr:hypothetical protein MHU86_16939 [Fragilaria crotonensis]
MRSCEYSDVGSRRTTSVIRDDVRFRQKGQDLQTTDRGQLENADTVSITFRRQRNGDKGATVTQHRNDRQGQTDICPVRVLADLTTRVRSYDCHSRTNPKINAVRTQDSDEPQHISSKSILRQLRMATTRAGGGLASRRVASALTRSDQAPRWPCTSPEFQVRRFRWWEVAPDVHEIPPNSSAGLDTRVAARMTSRQSFYDRPRFCGRTTTGKWRKPGRLTIARRTPLDNYHGTDTARRTRRETKLLGPDSDAIYLFLLVSRAQRETRMTTDNTRIDATVRETTVQRNHEADDSSD